MRPLLLNPGKIQRHIDLRCRLRRSSDFLGALRRTARFDSRAISHIPGIPAVFHSGSNPASQAGVDAPVELLLAKTEGTTKALLPARYEHLLAEAVALFPCREAGDDAVDEIEVGCEVIGCVPFDSTNIGSGWHRGEFLREVTGHINVVWVGDIEGSVRHQRGDGRVTRFVHRLAIMVSGSWKSNDVQVVEEYPKDLLRDVDHFLAPDSVRTWASHFEDEADGSLRLCWFWVFEVRENGSGAASSLRDWGRLEVGKQERGHDVSGRELAWTLLFLVEDHVEESREECALDLIEVMESQGCGGKCLQAEENLVQQGIFVFLSVHV